MKGSLRREFEQSAIRRGRLATSPTWFVDVEDGSVWKFQRKKDAVSFIIDKSCVCAGHKLFCRNCRGVRAQHAPAVVEDLLGMTRSLESVQTETFRSGVLYWVKAEKALYVFDEYSIETPASPMLIATSKGSASPGRWLRWETHTS